MADPDLPHPALSCGAGEPEIQSSAIDGFDGFLAARGIASGALLPAAGLPTSASGPAARIALDSFSRLMELAAEAAGDEALALAFVEAQDVNASGALAYAVRNAPTVRAGLTTMIEFLPTRVDLAHLELVVEGERAHLQWTLSPLVLERRQITDYAAASMVRRLGQMMEAGWQPLGVHLERPRPARIEPYRRMFGRHLRFDASMNAIVLPTSALDLPVPGADHHLYAVARALLARLLAERRRPFDLRTRLREEIVWALGEREGPQAERTARRLGLSLRSLQRRLAEEDTSFQALVDETRRALAVRYLADRRMNLSEIAYRLGFSAPSAFTRATHRWFGVRPSEMRRRLRTRMEVPGVKFSA